jgi:lipoprotein-anchoring transpeptidase ErfK/SrfK
LTRSLVLCLAAALVAGVGDARSAVAPRQELVALVRSHVARIHPNLRAPRVAFVSSRRPITGGRTVLPVLARRAGAHGRRWLLVALPGRPNGRSGWIRGVATTRRVTRWHLVVRTSSRRVLVFSAGRLVRTFAAVVGKPSTPTPFGSFFVEEAVELRRWDAGAPYALALSARSTVLQEFDGGPGQIALHGMSNVGGVLGTAASHGCVRLDDGAMRWLVTRFGAGVPVTIRR